MSMVSTGFNAVMNSATAITVIMALVYLSMIIASSHLIDLGLAGVLEELTFYEHVF